MTKIAPAAAHMLRESCKGRCACASIPQQSQHPLGAVIDPFAGVQTGRRGWRLAQMDVEVSRQNRAAAIGVADEEWH